MRREQTGFTMIELIVVIVILGILAATALPKFLDLRGDAIAASADGVAAQLSSAMSVNYAGCSATGHVVTANKCIAVSNCSQAANLLAGGVLPTNGNVTYSITAQALGSGAAGADGVTGDCTLSATNGTTTATVTFTGISAGL
ncbi:MAG: prepilin-type N-terminal cleavage/methylation domain-containing protein [Aquabacterium sp.]|uniref:type II secretion system protein n=1 Tax=Aquabacterium sp. TaxID=1872578 RepID=UPI0025BB16F5|nr:prepilin-type N-terminal cleavage/methylation domain-containing protein [Aquabacterium sp.]MBI5927552.1 prepilin-type N-terminal cleavage/methylation domain-containing protein [Aquabacterium sp.]